MKRIFLYGLLLFMFRDCEAQKLEIKYCPWFNNFTGTCVITCNDSTCMLQFNIVEKYVPGFLLWIDRSKESNKILCYDNELISIEQMNKVKDLYQKASCLASNSGYAMIDGNYLHITGTFYSDTLYNKFELYYPLDLRSFNS